MFNKLYSSIIKYMKENIKFLITLLVLYILLTANTPWSVNAPGGVINIDDRLDNKMYDNNGSINMTYVTFLKGNIPIVLLSYIMPNWDLVNNKDITLDGEDLEIANIRDRLSLKESISNATYLAYNKANVDIKIKRTQVFVSYILDEAKTQLKVGDKLLEINDKKIEKFSDIKEYLSNCNFNDEVTFKVLRDNKEKNIKAKVVNIDNEKKIGVTISTIKEFDMNPDIKYNYKKSESGGSGGFMLSLAIYNSLTEEDITRGMKVCGTGTIDEDGNVGEIGGVKYKLSGAVKNKCDIFLIGSKNYKEAVKVKKKNNYDINIISVNTFDEAISELNKI